MKDMRNTAGNGANDQEFLSHMESSPIIPSKSGLWTRDFIFIALINLTTFMGFNMTTTGMPIYLAQLGASDLIAGLATTFATGAALFVRPFTGILLDRFGRKSILLVGIGIMALIIAAYAIVPTVGIILSLRLIHGIGWGLSSTATSTIAADIIPKKRFAEGMGYVAMAASLATAIAPALAVAMLQNSGIRPMIAIAAGCTLLSLGLAVFQHVQNSASSKSISTSNSIQDQSSFPLRDPMQKHKLQLSDFFEKKALLPAGIMFLLNCAFASVMTFIALHGQARGVDNIFVYFTVYAIVTIITRPVIGKIIDKKGYFIPGILSAAGVAVTLVLISFSTNIVMFCVAGVFAGLGLGTGMGTLQAMALSSISPTRRGVATSTFLFGLDAGMAVGAAFAGSVADAVGYANMYLVVAIFPVIAGLIFIVLGRKRIAKYSPR